MVAPCPERKHNVSHQARTCTEERRGCGNCNGGHRFCDACTPAVQPPEFIPKSSPLFVFRRSPHTHTCGMCKILHVTRGCPKRLALGFFGLQPPCSAEQPRSKECEVGGLKIGRAHV